MNSSSPAPFKDLHEEAIAVNAAVIAVAVVLSVAAVAILVGVLYMAVRTNKKRSLDILPVSKEDKLRKFRLSLALGDLEPKVQRILVTMPTNGYQKDNLSGSGYQKDHGHKTPVKMESTCSNEEPSTTNL